MVAKWQFYASIIPSSLSLVAFYYMEALHLLPHLLIYSFFTSVWTQRFLFYSLVVIHYCHYLFGCLNDPGLAPLRSPLKLASVPF